MIKRYLLILIPVFLFGNIDIVLSAQVNDIRMWHAPDRSRIVFDMDAGARFNVFTLIKPDRVVIDLKNTQLKGLMPTSGTTGQFIEQIRLGYPKPDTMRLVFDVKKPVRYFIQMLRPIDNYKYRLVVDYYHQDAVVEADKLDVSSKPAIRKPPRNPNDELLILIDPGHGGEDPGASGSRAREKNVVLDIAKKLKSQINGEPGLRAELTRKGDYYVGLRKRTRIARDKNADIFVSIHADAFTKKNASGASVYVLSQRGASSETAKRLADKENSADLIGGVSLADKDDLVAEVLLDLSMSKTASESINFGRQVLSELKKIGKVHSKRVEQAGFVVLKSPDIPSILVETAYITNPKEETLLQSKSHQSLLAKAVVSGIKRYLNNTNYFHAN